MTLGGRVTQWSFPLTEIQFTPWQDITPGCLLCHSIQPMSPVNCSIPCQRLPSFAFTAISEATGTMPRLRPMNLLAYVVACPFNTALITLCRLVGASSSNHASLAEGWAVNYGSVSLQRDTAALEHQIGFRMLFHSRALGRSDNPGQ
jgi:hypothetical protein